MKKVVLFLLLASGTFALAGSLANACGDKFLIVGRCVSYQRLHRAPHPGSLLLVWSANSREGFAVRDPDLVQILAEAGHQVAVLEDPARLEKAMASEHFDLILVDIADADQIERTFSEGSGKATVVPVMSRATKAELTEAKQQHKYVLSTPSKRSRILAAVDGAMTRKPKS